MRQTFSALQKKTGKIANANYLAAHVLNIFASSVFQMLQYLRRVGTGFMSNRVPR